MVNLRAAFRARDLHGATRRALRSAPTIRASRWLAADILLESNPELHGMRVFSLLGAVRHMGEHRATRLLHAAGIQQFTTKRIGELTFRQSLFIAGELRGRP